MIFFILFLIYNIYDLYIYFTQRKNHYIIKKKYFVSCENNSCKLYT